MDEAGRIHRIWMESCGERGNFLRVLSMLIDLNGDCCDYRSMDAVKKVLGNIYDIESIEIPATTEFLGISLNSYRGKEILDINGIYSCRYRATNIRSDQVVTHFVCEGRCTALELANSYQNEEIMELLLEFNAQFRNTKSWKVSRTESPQCTIRTSEMAINAVIHHNPSILRLLYRYGYSFNDCRDCQGYGILEYGFAYRFPIHSLTSIIEEKCIDVSHASLSTLLQRKCPYHQCSSALIETDLQFIQYLFDYGMSLHYDDDTTWSLILAIPGSRYILSHLLQRSGGESICIEATIYGSSVLNRAIDGRNKEIIDWFIHDGNVNVQKDNLMHIYKKTQCYYDISSWIEIAKLLFDHLLSNKIIQPLVDHDVLQGAITLRLFGFVEPLLVAGYSLADNSLFSPLSHVIECHASYKILDYVDFNENGIPHPTKLCWQLLMEQTPTTKLYQALIKKGADMFACRTDQYGQSRTILQYLVYMREFHCDKAIELLETTINYHQITKEQFEKWITRQDKQGRTVLHQACYYGLECMVRFLVSAPSCIMTITDNDGRTALHYAVLGKGNRDNRKRCAHQIFLACSKLSCSSMHPSTCSSYSFGIMDSRDNRGKSPLDYAKESSQDILVTYLTKAILRL